MQHHLSPPPPLLCRVINTTPSSHQHKPDARALLLQQNSKLNSPCRRLCTSAWPGGSSPSCSPAPPPVRALPTPTLPATPSPPPSSSSEPAAFRLLLRLPGDCACPLLLLLLPILQLLLLLLPRHFFLPPLPSPPFSLPVRHFQRPLRAVQCRGTNIPPMGCAPTKADTPSQQNPAGHRCRCFVEEAVMTTMMAAGVPGPVLFEGG
mmetsp:Transcript_81318/g.158851  ORF Transcript_81318/g.158851 Transcript_81318/m.158851 type:complete len:206 (+) Transcript_81318:93-710(+)